MSPAPPGSESRRSPRGAGDRPVGKPAGRRGRPPGGNSDETRQAILDAALRHFAERGYASTTITAIAADVGLATSAFYHYFDGKEQLYEAVFFATAPGCGKAWPSPSAMRRRWWTASKP